MCDLIGRIFDSMLPLRSPFFVSSFTFLVSKNGAPVSDPARRRFESPLGWHICSHRQQEIFTVQERHRNAQIQCHAVAALWRAPPSDFSNFSFCPLPSPLFPLPSPAPAGGNGRGGVRTGGMAHILKQAGAEPGAPINGKRQRRRGNGVRLSISPSIPTAACRSGQASLPAVEPGFPARRQKPHANRSALKFSHDPT